MKGNESISNKSIVITAICFVLIVAIIVLALVVNNRNDTKNSSSNSSSQVSVEQADSSQIETSSLDSLLDSDTFFDDRSSKTSSDDSSFTVSHAVSANDWQLRLANSENIVTDYIPEVTVIPKYYCQDPRAYSFDSRAFEDLMSMIYTAESEGVNLLVLSSYRTYEYQNTLYQNKVAYYINLGYDRGDAETAAANVVAMPGTSDHNLGLAVDFNYLDQEYENEEELVWLKENAERFGFVMRYPEDKEEITGIIYEPWHYRYVGEENAQAMNELNMCLEEYVEYIENKS